MPLSKVRKGDSAVLFFATLLSEANFLVLQTFSEEAPFDLAIYHNGKFTRFQIKRAQPAKTPGRFTIPFRKITANSKKSKVYRYSADHTDFLVGVVMETLDVYCFPIVETSHIRSAITVDPLGITLEKFASSRKVAAEQYRNCLVLNGENHPLKSSTILVQ